MRFDEVTPRRLIGWTTSLGHRWFDLTAGRLRLPRPKCDALSPALPLNVDSAAGPRGSVAVDVGADLRVPRAPRRTRKPARLANRDGFSGAPPRSSQVRLIGVGEFASGCAGSTGSYLSAEIWSNCARFYPPFTWPASLRQRPPARLGVLLRGRHGCAVRALPVAARRARLEAGRAVGLARCADR